MCLEHWWMEFKQLMIIMFDDQMYIDNTIKLKCIRGQFFVLIKVVETPGWLIPYFHTMNSL